MAPLCFRQHSDSRVSTTSQFYDERRVYSRIKHIRNNNPNHLPNPSIEIRIPRCIQLTQNQRHHHTNSPFRFPKLHLVEELRCERADSIFVRFNARGDHERQVSERRDDYESIFGFSS